MFANFELYRGGWVSADTKRKYSRSSNGCLPCRKRKKRCDMKHPACGRCAKQNSPNCRYPSSGRTPTSSPLPRSNDLQTRPSYADIPRSSGSFQSVLSTSIQTKYSTPMQMSPCTLSSNLDPVPGLTQHLPACSLSELFLVFTPASHALDLGPESSIISLTIPLTAQSRAVFHAMIACSSIFLCQKQPSWRPIAIQHYCKALRSLALEMTEWNMCDPAIMASFGAIVIMLHFFEKFESSSRTSSVTHVLALQEIFSRACAKRPLDSTLSVLVLEALAYHIAINSTFHPEFLKAYTYLETLVPLHKQSPVLRSSDMEPFRCSLWLGLPLEMCDLIYKISYLQRLVPLTSNQWMEAVIISQRLRAMCLRKPPDPSFGTPKQRFEIEVAMYFIQRLYISAAELILIKIMDLRIQAADVRIQQMLGQALDDLTTFNSVSPLLMYPVVVLGTAAIYDKHRQAFISQLNRMRDLSGGHEVESALRFLQVAWGRMGETATSDDDDGDDDDDDGSDSIPLQLDVLLDDSLLRRVII